MNVFVIFSIIPRTYQEERENWEGFRGRRGEAEGVDNEFVDLSKRFR